MCLVQKSKFYHRSISSVFTVSHTGYLFPFHLLFVDLAPISISWAITLAFKTDFLRPNLIALWAAFCIPVLENVNLHLPQLKAFQCHCCHIWNKIPAPLCYSGTYFCRISPPTPSPVVDTYFSISITHLICTILITCISLVFLESLFILRNVSFAGIST